jgi:hypothetical protein
VRLSSLSRSTCSGAFYSIAAELAPLIPLLFLLLLAPFLLRQELFWSSFQEEQVFSDFLSVICSMIGYFLA